MSGGISMTKRSMAARALSGGGLLAAFAAAALYAAPTAAADEPYPPQAPCATTVLGGGLRPGADLTIVSTGFEPGGTATITLHSAPAVLGTVTADATGTINATVHVPSTLAPGAHTLTVSMPNRSCDLAVNSAGSVQGVVVSPPATNGGGTSGGGTNGGGTSGGGLAFTGAASMTALSASGGLLFGGAALLYLGRRRRRA